jgi:hypothetical protein
VFFIYKSVYEETNKYKILSGIFIGLCFLTKYTAIIFFVTIPIYFIFINLYANNYPKLKSLLYSIKNSFIVGIFTLLTVSPWLIRNGILFGFSFKGMLGYSSEISNQLYTVKTLGQQISGTGQTGNEIVINDNMTNLSNISTTTNAGLDTTNYIQNFIIQYLTNHGLIIFGCGVIFFIFLIWLFIYSYKKKDKKIFSICFLALLLVESLVILSTLHNINIPWRLHGRYLEPTFPLILIIGFIGFLKIKKLKTKIVYNLLIFSCSISLFLTNTWGHMGGMISASYIGIMQNIPLYFEKFLKISLPSALSNYYQIIILTFIIIIFAMLFLLIRKKVSKKKIFVFSCLLILSSTLISSTGYMLRDENTSKSELYEFGNWLNNEFSGKNNTIFIDETLNNVDRQIAVWINSPITLGSWENNYNNSYDYLISTYDYNYTVVYTSVITSPLDGVKGRIYWQHEIYVYHLKLGE